MHEEIFIKINSFKKSPFKLKNILYFLFEIIFEICFKFGKFALKIIRSVILGLVFEVTQTKKSLKQKLLAFKKKSPFSNLLILFLGLAISGIIIFIFYGFSNIKSTLENTLKIGDLGKESLKNAGIDLNSQNLNEAELSLIKAQFFFSDAQKEFTYLDQETKILLKVVPIEKEANKILRLGTLFSETGQELVNLGKLLKSVKISPEGILAEKEGGLTDTLNESEKSLNKIQEYLNEIEKILEDLDTFIYPENIKQEISSLKTKFSELKVNFNSVKNIFFALRSLFENNDRILIILQNNNELRPSGGFLGTLAELKMKNGKINNLKVESVYEKDGQLLEKIKPPHPIMNVNSRWYLRDSNWFADFSKSSKKIIDFYEKEGGETPKAVIAITPKLITDLLSYTGPIYIEKYNITLNSENFVEMAEIGSSSSPDDPENKPKQFLADFIPILLANLSNKHNNYTGLPLQIFQNNIAQKNIQFYSRDAKLQKSFVDLGWAGNIIDSKNDYLNIISSNLEGTKTDLSINQEINLVSSVDKKGNILNTLKITRENRLPKLPKTFNQSFIRILVPKGSVLMSNDGFDYKILDTKSLEDTLIDPEAFAWENGIIRDLQSGTIIGAEEDKTFFGNWLKLEGGEKKTITLKYKLPFKIENKKQYSLIIQKQPGALAQKVEYQISAPYLKTFFATKTPASDKNGEIGYNFELDTDKFFGFIFKNK